MHAQGNELARRGYRVVMLAPSRFFDGHPNRGYERISILAVSNAVSVAVVRRGLFALLAMLIRFCSLGMSYDLAQALCCSIR